MASRSMCITVAAASVPDVKGDRDANLRAASKMTMELAAAGAQIVVLPEACLQGYAVAEPGGDPQRLREMAEPFDGPYAQAFRDLARQAGVHLVAGYDRRVDTNVYNTAELIGPHGETIGVYDKVHVGSPPDKGFYAPGQGLAVWDTELCRVGILICVDRTVHENWRVLMLQGAELIVIPANGGYGDDNTHRLVTMARDNAVCCAFAHPRRALVIGADGGIVDHDKDPLRPHALGTLDLSRIASRQSDVRSRRRPELYGLITRPETAQGSA
ncbi:MAG: carbon-nitrogen hydrolase family protein [Planctomycetes bacterium]|nr:carbon-nitrogen hydrolase family protein [Planctomycetota bacterium]